MAGHRLFRELARDADVRPVTAEDVVAAIVLRAAAGCDVLLTSALADGTRFVGLDGRGGPDAPAGEGGLVVEDPFTTDL